MIELIVVIAIIAILAAVTTAGLSGALGKARTAKCQGNLRTIGTGLIAFAGDNNGNFPTAGGVIQYNTSGAGALPWSQQLGPYVGTGQNNPIFKCPDSSRYTSLGCQYYSYFIGAHAAYAQKQNGSHGFGPVNIQKMRALSQHILAGDIAFNVGTNQPLDADKDDYTQDPAFNSGTPSAPTTIPIHGGFSNIVFADGHVESLKYFDKNSYTTVYEGPGFDYLYQDP